MSNIENPRNIMKQCCEEKLRKEISTVLIQELRQRAWSIASKAMRLKKLKDENDITKSQK